MISNSSRLGVVVVGLLRKTRIALMRLPKNIRSNRLWLFWNGRIYLATGHSAKNTRAKSCRIVEKFDNLESLPRYVALRSCLSKSPQHTKRNSGVLLQELGRFGNMTGRLASALFQANIHGLQHVIIPREVEFSSGLFVRDVHTFPSRYQVWFSSTASTDKNPVTVLYTSRVLRRVPPPVSNNSQAGEQAWADSRALLVPTSEREPFRPDHLVIHLRGGDVFGPRKPKSYGQPPLSYYQLVLDHEKWSRVTVVHEDDSNPVIAGIVEACRARNLDINLQSSTLAEDLLVLLLARTLVAGRGTFIPAIVGLSDVASRVFFFEDKFALQPPKKGVRLHRISDKKGDYVRQVLSNNWENSPEQQAMMLSYPAENLVVENS